MATGNSIKHNTTWQYFQDFEVYSHFNWSDSNLYVALFVILFNPLFWNAIGRLENKTHILDRMFGSPYIANYIFGSFIIALGICRAWSIHNAILNQPNLLNVFPLQIIIISNILAVPLVGAGTVLVCSSFWTLGFTGTFLGDHFGILMSERVTTFPFTIFNDPMYIGSTLNFLGTGLWYSSPAGILMGLFVGFCYRIALVFEGPFTEEIYKNRASTSAKKLH